jgi:hypothetical protein
MLLALIALPLVACGPSSNDSPGKLPYPPSDLQTCFRGVVGVPDKALSVSEVEALWKIDRVRVVVNQRCGNRLLQWYTKLRANWR